MIKIKNHRIFNIRLQIIHIDEQCHKGSLQINFMLLEVIFEFNEGFIKSYSD